VKALSGLFGRLQIAHGFPLLPKASPSVYACCVVFAGLSSLIFRFPHCCAQSGISFIMNVPDILIYYGLISS
jgi:hypothetical protein